MKIRQLKLENQVSDSAEAGRNKYRKTNMSYLIVGREEVKVFVFPLLLPSPLCPPTFSQDG